MLLLSPFCSPFWGDVASLKLLLSFVLWRKPRALRPFIHYLMVSSITGIRISLLLGLFASLYALFVEFQVFLYGFFVHAFFSFFSFGHFVGFYAAILLLYLAHIAYKQPWLCSKLWYFPRNILFCFLDEWLWTFAFKAETCRNWKCVGSTKCFLWFVRWATINMRMHTMYDIRLLCVCVCMYVYDTGVFTYSALLCISFMSSFLPFLFLSSIALLVCLLLNIFFISTLNISTLNTSTLNIYMWYIWYIFQGFSIFLVYVLIFKLQEICLVCFTTHTANFLFFVFTTYRYFVSSKSMKAYKTKEI